jgi:nicotinate-nucleotide adenylyltransferase
LTTTRTGILGGSFNPPHIGHLVCAREALARLGLDRVLLMPVAVPPHKPIDSDPGADVRLELCRLAVGDEEGLEASDLEVARGGMSYTVDTLASLRESDPQAELTFIAGGDMAASLPQWREPERVLALARFAVAERGDADREAIESAVAGLRGGDRLVFFEMPRIDVSSTLVRSRVAKGRRIGGLVPDAVAGRIGELGLYGAEAASG